eukprot:4479530-Amphidinium_carterae.1
MSGTVAPPLQSDFLRVKESKTFTSESDYVLETAKHADSASFNHFLMTGLSLEKTGAFCPLAVSISVNAVVAALRRQ